MAGKAVTGKDRFFEAVNQLTYREMREVGTLIAMQLEDKSPVDESAVAEALSDASECHFQLEDGQN